MSGGIYIHIPFCRSRCSYCDFATSIYQTELVHGYVGAVVQEVTKWRQLERPERIDTIYFGGGTPSLLSASQLEEILTAVHNRFSIDERAEVTMEINPGSVTPETLQHFRKLGINRASFGAQTFDDRELARLGRSHSSAQTRQMFYDLRAAGFENISFDLIAGLPGQTLDVWERNIEEALSLRPEHLSFYLLEVHEGTPLAEHIKQGKQPKPDDDVAASMYELMLERSCRAGYEHYEISNLCLDGFEARHNMKYWTGEPYYGFGCSAHSFDGELRRWANERDTRRYVELIASGGSPICESSILSKEERRAESMFLGLRLMSGISRREHEERFGSDVYLERLDEMKRFCDAGLLEVSGDQIKLTRAGALVSNEVFATLV